jgi:WD40 repeat protein
MKPICLGDPNTGQQIGEPLSGHTDWVSDVAFGPDEQLLASGSSDYNKWPVPEDVP